MELYNLTLQKPSAIQRLVYGSFSKHDAEEIVVSYGNILELWELEDDNKLSVLCTTNTFSNIRSIQAFRPVESEVDYLVVGSDSGRICILQYNPEQKRFVICQKETYGKSGVRRIIPGQYLATDPHGRAIMISAVEKSNIVYVLNRDTENRLTISSPIEANKSQTIIYDTCGIDVDYDDPTFAVLEVDYSECDEDSTGRAYNNVEKHVTYYQYDTGLNHVIRKWTTAVERSSNCLLAVPGVNHLSGVLVFSENYVSYVHENHPLLKAVLPRRRFLPLERGTLIIATCSLHIKKDMWFFAQSEYGDVYLIQLEYENNTVTDLIVRYYDTIPPASNICVTHGGLFIATSEAGDHTIYKIESLGADDDVAEARASTLLGEDNEIDVPIFVPRSLTNMQPITKLPSLCPCTSMLAADLTDEGLDQIYALCGKNSRSTLRVLKPGLDVYSYADASLGNKPGGIWCLNGENGYSKYILVGYKNSTLVLNCEGEIEEDTNNQFLTEEATLHSNTMEGNSYIQVTKTCLIQIFPTGSPKKWMDPKRKRIVCAASNSRQVVLALEHGELVYFELDERLELMEKKSISLQNEITCMDLPMVPPNHTRSLYLAVGCRNSSVTLFSLDYDKCLDYLSIVASESIPTSVTLETMVFTENETSSLFLTIGTEVGYLSHQEVNLATNQIESTSKRFLGAASIRLAKICTNDKNSILVLAKKPYLFYPYNGTSHLTLLNTEVLSCACYFNTEECPQAILGVHEEILHILSVLSLGTQFTCNTVNLSYTPRMMASYPSEENRNLFILEADQNTYPLAEKQKLYEEEPQFEEGTTEQECGYPITPEPGKWGSCIEVVDPKSLSILQQLQFDNNEAALCCCFAQFESMGEEQFFIVGTAKDLTFKPRACTEGYIYVYRVLDGQQLNLFNKTTVENEIPKALCPFQGRLCVGIGKLLRIYDLGKKRLLKKCEYRNIQNLITNIHSAGDRIYVGDITSGYTVLKYRKTTNRIVSISDSSVPRSLTCSCQLDYHTLCGADKMGNIFIERVNPKIDDNIANPTGNDVFWNTGFLNGAPNKNELMASIYIGEIVTSIQKAHLVPAGREILLYTTITGRIGALLPMDNRSLINDFQQLEMWLREKQVSICGRDVISYRSQYVPIKDVIDGDLCEMFGTLSHASQYEIASALDRSIPEIQSKLEDLRASII